MDKNKAKELLLDLAQYTSTLNSGHDADCVFYYIEKFLNAKFKIKIDIENELDKLNDDDFL